MNNNIEMKSVGEMCDEIKSLRAAVAKLKETKVDHLSEKFDMWREVQQATNPQYTIVDEIDYLLSEDPGGADAKKIFDELYAEHGYTLNIAEKSYDENDEEEESDEECR